MPELHSIEEVIAYLNRAQDEWRANAKFPRVPSNPYGDNTIGVAFDEGWWSCLAEAHAKGWFKEGVY